ncbi:MAG: outer membrane protein transport protein [Gammaproteobacteria bacterium]|nr:outer membrane protein transport protein [Gammaproteobacteria bacterium]
MRRTTITDNNHTKGIHRSLATLAILLACSPLAHGSGFRLPELTLPGTALSNAVVADPDERGTYPYNPAAAGLHDDNSLYAGLILIDPHLKSDAAATPPGLVESNGESPVPVPNLSVAWHVPDSPLAVNINVTAPFGLETKWPIGNFSGSPTDPTHTKVELINLNPNLVYRLGPDTSIAVGADYYYLRETVFNSAASSLEGDGADWGWNVAFIHRAGDWTVGGSYRSSVEMDVTGTFGLPFGSEALQLPAGTVLPAKTGIEFPAMLQLGVHYAVNDQWSVEFDLERTYWSSFDQLDISAKHPNPIIGWTLVTSDVNNWDDSNAYRLGFRYRPDALNTWRFGYTYDQTPQPELYFSARVPDADRHLFSIGYGRQLTDALSVDLAYMYVRFEDRTVDGATNVTYNGDYESDAHLFGGSLNWSF